MSPAAASNFACACDDASATGASWWRILVGAFLAVNSMAFAMAINSSEATVQERLILHLSMAAASVVVTILLGWPLAVASWEALRRKQVTIEALFVLSYAGATLASAISMLTGEGPVYWEVAGITLVVYSLGRAVGRYSQQRILQSLAEWDPQAKKCDRLLPDGETETISIAAVRRGDVLRVHPGMTIPVDGLVDEGRALVREAEMTGESLAAVRAHGDAVFAGTTVLDSTLYVRASAAGTERQLDRIAAALDALSARPAPSQVIADRMMRWFVPALMLLAAATAAYWYAREGTTSAVFNAMSVLLVACPCALGFATPVTVWSAMRRLNNLGFLAKNGAAIEKLASVDTAVFDKTGTLTTGEFSAELLVTGCVPEPLVRRLVACAEASSQHPIAACLRGLAADHGLQAQRIELLPGAGLAAVIGERRVEIGMASVLCPDLDDADDEAHRLAIVVNGEPAAVIRLHEVASEGVSATIDTLQSGGLDCVLMTGDSEVRAARIPIAHRHSRVTPDQKLELCRELAAKRGGVAFVGDGLNDAAAMSASSVSIAMEHGANLALDVADVIATRGLRVLPEVIGICRSAVRSIHGTNRIAVAYNVVGCGLAAAGMLHPVAASILMTVSSMVVTWRALQLVEAE